MIDKELLNMLKIIDHDLWDSFYNKSVGRCFIVQNGYEEFIDLKEFDLVEPVRDVWLEYLLKKSIQDKRWYLVTEIAEFNSDKNGNSCKWRALITQYNGRTTGYDTTSTEEVNALLGSYLEAMEWHVHDNRHM